jgi:hypothetical protein
MTISNNLFFRRGAQLLRLASVLILAGFALWLLYRVPVNYAKTGAPANPLPDLRGHAAVEHLKQEGLYNTLAEAVAAARYNADPAPSGDAYRFSNPAQRIRATFTSSGARFVSSKGGRDRELATKLIGYGYGSRMTTLDSQNIVARRNRIEHEYSVKESALRTPHSAIKEWFVNSEAGIEHGFTLPEPPPTGRGDGAALRVEMEIGGDFEPRLDAAGQAVTLGCGRGADGLTYDKLRVYDARNREVAARFEIEGKRLAILVDEGQAEYPLTIDPLYAQQAKLKASDLQIDASFGASVATSGDTVAVAMPNDSEFDFGIGAAYVFVRSGTTWTQQQKLTASDSEPYDRFGASVAISGNTVVVGKSYSYVYTPVTGAAYVFVRNGTTWSEQQKLTASDGNTYLGDSVAISGDTVVVGGGAAAYVFVRNGTTWSEQQKLTTSDAAAFFGASVAISGDTVAVGAPSPYYPPYPEQGAAYVFVRNGTTWTQQQKLMASDAAVDDLFGFSVAISGNTVAVGAHQANIGGNMRQGAAYVFTRSGTTWTQQQKLTASDGNVYNSFGHSIGISVNTVVVGAPHANIGANTYQGAAYVFARSGTTWTQQQKLTASDGGFNHWFGASAAISVDRVVVGAIGEYYFSGAAYVFVP